MVDVKYKVITSFNLNHLCRQSSTEIIELSSLLFSSSILAPPGNNHNCI